MTQIVIKGHATRGKEVIKILEMLGGTNVGYGGCGSQYYNYIDNFDNIIGTTELPNYKKFKIFTLKEFLEKFPYKVGDKVIYKNNIELINRMRWDGKTIKYGFFTARNIGEVSIEDLEPYKE